MPNQPLITGRTVRHDGFSTGFRNDGLPLRRDVGQSFFPGNTNELTFTFGTDSLQRILQSIGMIHTFQIMIHLVQQGTSSERMLWITVVSFVCPSRDQLQPGRVSGQSCPHAPRIMLRLLSVTVMFVIPSTSATDCYCRRIGLTVAKWLELSQDLPRFCQRHLGRPELIALRINSGRSVVIE